MLKNNGCAEFPPLNMLDHWLGTATFRGIIMSKKCRKCKELKDFGCFYKSKGGDYDLYSYCKDCTRLMAKKYYLINKDKINKRTALYIKSEAGISTINLHRQSERFKSSRAAIRGRYKKKNPLKTQARSAVQHAITAGRLIRLPCEVKGCKTVAEAHHDDYSKLLEVKWLCKLHHTELHKNYL